MEIFNFEKCGKNLKPDLPHTWTLPEGWRWFRSNPRTLKKQYLTLLRAQFRSRLEGSWQIETSLTDFECDLTSPLESPCSYYCDTSSKYKDCRNDAGTAAGTFNPTQSMVKGWFGRKSGHNSNQAAKKIWIFQFWFCHVKDTVYCILEQLLTQNAMLCCNLHI